MKRSECTRKTNGQVARRLRQALATSPRFGFSYQSKHPSGLLMQNPTPRCLVRVAVPVGTTPVPRGRPSLDNTQVPRLVSSKTVNSNACLCFLNLAFLLIIKEVHSCRSINQPAHVCQQCSIVAQHVRHALQVNTFFFLKKKSNQFVLTTIPVYLTE